jgi:hypothetical protein
VRYAWLYGGDFPEKALRLVIPLFWKKDFDPSE